MTATSSDQVTVKVLLKVESWFTATPYEPGDMLHEALSFTTEYTGRVDLLRIMFAAQRGLAEKYGNRRNLSVGDVVVIGEQAFAVEPVDWKPVHVEAYQIWHDGEPMFLVTDDDEAIAD